MVFFGSAVDNGIHAVDAATGQRRWTFFTEGAVRLAPTVLFLGPEGEVAERLIGYGSPDFFGAYLDQRLAQARAALKSAAR